MFHFNMHLQQHWSWFSSMKNTFSGSSFTHEIACFPEKNSNFSSHRKTHARPHFAGFYRARFGLWSHHVPKVWRWANPSGKYLNGAWWESKCKTLQYAWCKKGQHQVWQNSFPDPSQVTLVTLSFFRKISLKAYAPSVTYLRTPVAQAPKPESQSVHLTRWKN